MLKTSVILGLLLAILIGVVISSLHSFSMPIHLKKRGRDKLALLHAIENHGCNEPSNRCRPVCRRNHHLRHSSSSLDDRARSIYDRSYCINITVGSFARTYSVILDTGSMATWLTAPECTFDPKSPDQPRIRSTQNACTIDPDFNRTRQVFPYKESLSFHTKMEPYNASYATGNVSGFIGTDDMALGKFQLPGQDLLVVNKMSSNFGRVVADGFAGLAYPRQQPEEPKSLLESLLHEFTFFSLYLRRSMLPETDDGGALTWGALDNEHCDFADVIYVNLTNVHDSTANPGHLWEVIVEDFTFDGTRIRSRAHDPEPKLAGVDSGSSVIILPLEQRDEYVTLNNAEYTHGVYAVECDAVVTSINFVINNHTFVVPSSSLIVKHEKVTPRCALAVDAFPFFDSKVEILLGQPFLRSFCTVWNFTQGAIGFASIKQ